MMLKGILQILSRESLIIFQNRFSYIQQAIMIQNIITRFLRLLIRKNITNFSMTYGLVKTQHLLKIEDFLRVSRGNYFCRQAFIKCRYNRILSLCQSIRYFTLSKMMKVMTQKALNSSYRVSLKLCRNRIKTNFLQDFIFRQGRIYQAKIYGYLKWLKNCYKYKTCSKKRLLQTWLLIYIVTCSEGVENF